MAVSSTNPAHLAKDSFELIESIDVAIADMNDAKQLLTSVGMYLLSQPETDCVFIMTKNCSGKLETDVELSKHHDAAYSLQTTIVEQAIQNGNAIVTGDITQYSRTDLSIGKAATLSVLAAPIRNHQSIYGVIYLGSAKLNAFTSEHVSLLTHLGGHIGLALENLRLSSEAIQNQNLNAAGQSSVNLSHSIKNILQAIGGAAEVIDYGFKTNQIDKARKSWEILKRNVERLKTFTLNMLAFSRDTKPVLTNCQLNRIVESAVESLRSSAKEKGVSIVLEMDEQIPARQMDADNMHDVVLNLVMNAIDAVEENKGIVTISTQYDESKSTIGLSVKDNGPGISNEEKNKIWLPFHTTKPKGGTGLGLPIVRKIIDKHNGMITLDSQPGRGAKFSISLPVQQQ
jgi:two-component system, NtrC family, sensor kinase